MQSKWTIPFTRGQIRSKTIRRFTIKNHKAVITSKKGIGIFRMILSQFPEIQVSTLNKYESIVQETSDNYDNKPFHILPLTTVVSGWCRQAPKARRMYQSISTTRLAIDIIELIHMAILLQKYIQLLNFCEYFLVLKE